MQSGIESVRVPLDGVVMELRPSEVASVAAGFGSVDAAGESISAVVDALLALPASDRAPFWELAVRHYGRRKPLEQAAGEIGMDVVRAQALVESFSDAVSAAPRPQGMPTR
jgi:hypothetical protein